LPWSGTFHHIGYRLLRIYAPLLGYQNNFTVLDSADSESVYRLCIKEFKPESDGVKRFPSASAIASVVSYARNAQRHLGEVVEERFSQWIHFLPEIEKIAGAYERRKKEANAMDFDDLLVNTLLLLNDPRVAQKYSEQFKYILVDEYQDTNHIQAAIIYKLSTVHNNVLVVGDDAQSIYSFRAANIQNILQFEKKYPGATIFKLETNYRSSKEIVAVANSVIENNREQYKKRLKTVLEGVKPELYPQLDQNSEAVFIADTIEKFFKDGVSPREVAVLFRASHHSQMLEVELVKRGIAYDYRGGVRFFERSHIKDVLAYLRLMVNLADVSAWLRVLEHEEGIGPAAAEKVISAVHEFIKQAGPEPDIKKITDVGFTTLGGKALRGWTSFAAIWNQLVEVVDKGPSELIEAVAASSYAKYLDGEFVDSKERLQDIKQFALFAEKYDSLTEFLADTTLQESYVLADGALSPPVPKGSLGTRGGGREEKIVLSTIHQAKGLEWSLVFIINLSSGSFPSDRALREDKGIEEERRLFYVAITRAKKYLYLTYPMAGGAYGDFLSGPSMFFSEIDASLFEDHSLLSTDTTVLNDPYAGVTYESEDKPLKIKPGSFLRDLDDL
jgi:DNA helicase-2/ATP-dependent DNA helicase PcrA